MLLNAQLSGTSVGCFIITVVVNIDSGETMLASRPAAAINPTPVETDGSVLASCLLEGEDNGSIRAFARDSRAAISILPARK